MIALQMERVYSYFFLYINALTTRAFVFKSSHPSAHVCIELLRTDLPGEVAEDEAEAEHGEAQDDEAGTSDHGTLGSKL